MMPTSDIELTEREEAIAKRAAHLAVKEITDDFYRSVGKTVITRVLVLVGACAVTFAIGKGWISPPGP